VIPASKRKEQLMTTFTSCIAAIVAFLIVFVILVSIPNVRFSDASTACVTYQSGVNTIIIGCDASFSDVVQAINDPQILEQEEVGVYLLNANLQVADGVSFEMTSNGDGLQYLKLAGENGIIVYGKILIDGVKITSWDISEEDVIPQDMNGTIRRGYVQFAASEGAQILNSEFGYLGDVEPGRRGFDLFGGGGPSHDMVIRGSKFHDMWMAFYSNRAYNIVIDDNEYFNNIKYALDPHTGTYNMNITNNWVHHNIDGIICSDDCYNILIEGNLAQDNSRSGIFLSRNMTDSVVRNNHVINARTPILISESPNNQIYNNTIEGATDEAILLLTPDVPDDGVTEGNMIYDNVISDSENGIRAARSHDNIIENTTFSNITASEYVVAGTSSLMIRGQDFDDVLISGGGPATQNQVQIVDSGMIEVEREADDGGDEEDGGDDNDDDDDDDEDQEMSYNTDIEPFTATLSDDDTITINS
jgi:poly(beta-D-mannuronate) C5 epimerase